MKFALKNHHCTGIMLFLFSALWLAGANAEPTGDLKRGEWKSLKEKSGVQMAQRTVENSPFLETRGTFKAKVKLFDAMAVLNDIEACPSWLFDCKQGAKLNAAELPPQSNLEASQSSRTYYTVIDAPFTFKDRDTVVQSSLCYQADEQMVTITMRGAESLLPLEKNRVRVLNFSGLWQLQQISDGWLDMTYQLHSDPQIGASGSVNRTMRKSVRQTILNVARLAGSEAYQNSQPSEEEIAEMNACSD